jgi:hypothetical protein
MLESESQLPIHRPMLDSQNSVGSTPLLCHIFPTQSSQTQETPQSLQLDTHYYTQLTDQLLDQFYPKFCCGARLAKSDSNRDSVLRCPKCHKQQTRLSGTPLHHLKLPRWTFSYLLKESQLQYPKVLTSTEITKRLGVSYTTAIKLKRRLQLFASHVVPRMQKKFYQDNKLKYHNFKFPKDRNQDLTEIVRDQPIPQADTVVLYSCGTLANKGRKRYKHKGQTSSIYMSESLGGKQVGTLVNTLATKKGPVFYDSIPNSKAETVNPIVFKYIPVHNPIFTDMGYSLPSWNHRKINHSRKSSDKRNKWSRQRWSKNGIHSQVAEGRNSVLKRSFASYVWINPTYSTLYLNEYSFLANLNHFALDDLLPSESRKIEKPDYQMDDNWTLRGFARDYVGREGFEPSYSGETRFTVWRH